MKTITTIPGWVGVEPPAIRPRRRQIGNLLGRSHLAGLRDASALVGLLLLVVYIGPLLRLADTTAAVVDIGVLSLVLLAAVALATFLAVSRRLLGLLWPVLRDYQRNHFSNNFKSLSPWQKITFYLVVFFGLLYAFVCCLAAVF